MDTEGFLATEIADAAAAAGKLDARATVNALRRYGSLGIIKPCWRSSDAPNAWFRYSREQGAIGLILASLAQRAEINDATRLRAAARHLMEDTGRGVTLIERVLRDVEDGGEPCFGISIWTHASGKRSNVFSVRLDAERGDPVDPPGRDCVAWVAGHIELAPLLRAFVTSSETVH